MKTSEVLNRAADLIEERGWTTGSGWHHEEGGPLCLEGGILAAIGGSVTTGDHYRCPAYAAVRAYLNDKAPFIWNDNLPYHQGSAGKGYVGGSRVAAYEYGREQVIATLRAAALLEAAKETPATIAAATLIAADEHADVPSAAAAILVAGLGAAAAVEAAGVRS